MCYENILKYSSGDRKPFVNMSYYCWVECSIHERYLLIEARLHYVVVQGRTRRWGTISQLPNRTRSVNTWISVSFFVLFSGFLFGRRSNRIDIDVHEHAHCGQFDQQQVQYSRLTFRDRCEIFLVFRNQNVQLKLFLLCFSSLPLTLCIRRHSQRRWFAFSRL